MCEQCEMLNRGIIPHEIYEGMCASIGKDPKNNTLIVMRSRITGQLLAKGYGPVSQGGGEGVITVFGSMEACTRAMMENPLPEDLVDEMEAVSILDVVEPTNMDFATVVSGLFGSVNRTELN